MMNAPGFAWRSLIRQPARATLGILGVAAVGALLFDMLLLSNGLVLSMRDLFTTTGFDIRVTASTSLLSTGPLIDEADEAAEQIAALSSVESVVTLRVAEALLSRLDVRDHFTSFQGAGGGGEPPWNIIRGRHARARRELVINENTVRRLTADVGDSITVRASCIEEPDAMPPLTFTVVGVADFPFDSANGTTAGVTISATLINASLRSSAGCTAWVGICGSVPMRGMACDTPLHPRADTIPSPMREAAAVKKATFILARNGS